MPPFLPRKRVSSEDPPPPNRQPRPDNPQASPQAPHAPFHLSDSDSDSNSLRDAPEGLLNKADALQASDESEDEEEDIDWEDAIDAKTSANTPYCRSSGATGPRIDPRSE